MMGGNLHLRFRPLPGTQKGDSVSAVHGLVMVPFAGPVYHLRLLFVVFVGSWPWPGAADPVGLTASRGALQVRNLK